MLSHWSIAFSVVLNEDLPARDSSLEGLLRLMRKGMGFVYHEETENTCRRFNRFNVENLVNRFGKIYRKAKEPVALHLKGVALLLLSQEADEVEERCVETFESYVVAKCPSRRGWKGHVSSYEGYFCLALCYCRRFCATGRISDRQIGMQYLMRFCESGLLTYVFRETVLNILFLFEKGRLSRREYRRCLGFRVETSEISPRSLEKISQNIVLISNDVESRSFMNRKEAFNIYTTLQYEDHPYF